MAKRRLFCSGCGLPLGPKGHPKGGCAHKDDRKELIAKIKLTDPKLAAQIKSPK